MLNPYEIHARAHVIVSTRLKDKPRKITDSLRTSGGRIFYSDKVVPLIALDLIHIAVVGRQWARYRTIPFAQVL